MLLSCFFLSLLTVVLTGVFVYRRRKEFRVAVTTMLVGIIAVITLLIFPMYLSSYDTITSAVFALIYALRALTGCQTVDVAHKVLIEGWLYYAYYAILYLAFITAPVFTTGFLVSVFGNVLDRVRFALLTGKKIHIFSELNESAVLLAENTTSPGAKYIFCNFRLSNADKDNELVRRVRNIGGIILGKAETELKFEQGKKSLCFYQISKSKDYNITNALALIEKYRERQGVHITVFSTGIMTELLLDSTDKGNIRVKLIDEVKYSCYNLLNSAPLFEGVINDKISALIIGGGYTGIEMLKAIAWCGQLSNCSLEINLIDKDADAIESDLRQNCPEMFNGEYQIRFIRADVNSVDFEKALDEYGRETTYAVVSMGEDEMNIDTAVFLRKYFLRNDRKHFRNRPRINLRVRDALKNAKIDSLSDENIISHELNAFGSMEKVFNARNLTDCDLEEMAKRVHLAYSNVLNGTWDAVEKAMESYYVKEYNQRSSFASALHIKYKLYACGIRGLSGAPVSEQQINEIERMLKEEASLDMLAKLEHQRWNAFVRSEGWCRASLEDLQQYYNMGSRPSHVHYLAKLHPCIVEWDQLDAVSKAVSEAKGFRVDFKQDDYDIIRRIPDILRINLTATPIHQDRLRDAQGRD